VARGSGPSKGIAQAGIGVLLTVSACVIPISQQNGGGGGNTNQSDAAASSTSTGQNNPPAPDSGIDDDATVPTGSWSSVTANLQGMTSSCGSLSLLSVKPDEDMLIASVFGVGLFANKGGDGTWNALGSGAGSDPITHGLTYIDYDPTNTQRFWECGSHGSPPSVTSDDGQTFTTISTTVDNNDEISVDFADANRQTILVGAHELAQTVWLTTNAGQNWTNIGAGLPGGSFCTNTLLVDAMTYLVGCTGEGGGPTGIYRTTDAGQTWAMVSASGGGRPPLVASDKSIYWASPNGAGMVRSTDNGVTWNDVLGDGVIATDSSPCPIELPSGKLAVMGQQYVLISSDHGATWSPATAALPQTSGEDIHGVVYSSPRKAFYIWHNACGNGALPVLGDAVMRFDYDDTQP
jgi:hypothetical protein